MSDVLKKITDHKRLEVAAARQAQPLAAVKDAALAQPPARDFFAALTTPVDQLRVIAEVKRASPSAGLIRPDFDPVAIARAYAAHGAAAISCLTDEKFFQGRLEYIAAIRAAVKLPVLRKDFIVDAYQIHQARAAGADAVLLIAECLTDSEIRSFHELISSLGMATLMEVHDAQNLDRVRPLLAQARATRLLLGINNRDLRTMTVDLAHTLRLLEGLEDRGLVVSESGIKTPADVQRLRDHGVHRILVGEHLMRQQDVGKALGELLAKG